MTTPISPDIVEKAREVVADWFDRGNAGEDDDVQELTAAIAAALQSEIEACADIADQHASVEGIAQRIAAQIRARLSGSDGKSPPVRTPDGVRDVDAMRKALEKSRDEYISALADAQAAEVVLAATDQPRLYEL